MIKEYDEAHVDKYMCIESVNMSFLICDLCNKLKLTKKSLNCSK